jgi:hypothetical protein
MRDWIAPLAEKELSAAYNCFDSDYRHGQTIERDRFKCSPDGMMVHLTKGRNLQIVNVRNPHD